MSQALHENGKTCATIWNCPTCYQAWKRTRDGTEPLRPPAEEIPPTDPTKTAPETAPDD